MAYQPKSYRKFAATTATAAMVASAVAPVASLAAGFTDVAPQYKEAVDFLVSTGATNGKTETQFGVYEQITRLDAAVILAKVLKLDVENAKDAGFTDVPKDRAKYVNALVEAGILNGKGDGKFGAYDNLSRVEMAKIVANAYKLEKQNDSALPFTDVNATWAPFVKALYDNGVTSGKTPTSFGAYENITRGDFARFVFKAANVNVAPAVVSVSAINANTVEVKGTGLDKLTAENFSLEGNKVTSYNVNAETGVATLTFEKKFESGKEQTLKLTEKVEGQEDKVSEFKFTYNLEIKSVVANALTVDDDTAGQKLTFKINGEATDADVDYIKASGYNVEFQATSAVFTGSASSSTTGELAASLTPDTKFAYKVVITDKDGNVVAESPLAEVKVVNKSNVVTAIDSFDLTDGTIKLSSNTVVLGESFRIANVVGDKADGTKDTDITSLVEFTSSNKDVALVDSTGNILPIKPGTTTITVKAGDVSKSFVLTVASEARVAKTATLTTSSLKLVEGGSNASVGVVVKDQYGDVVSGLNLANATYEITQVTVNGTPTDIVNVTGGTTDAEGKASLTVTPAAAGTGTVKVKVGNNVIATFNVSVSKDTTVATRKLELVDASKDTKLDIYTGEVQDNTVTFAYNKYNAAGYLLGAETNIGTSGTTYTVSVEEANGKDIIDASVNNGVITVTAKQHAGTAYLVIKEGSVVREKLAITVVDSTPTVSAITLKSAEKVTTATNITASSVLTLKTETNKDSVVQNITLTTASTKAIRLDETTGKIYLDTDNDGAYDTGELVVGTVEITENISGSATGTTIATAPGDKGSVVYSVKDASGKVIATSVIDVEVPSN
ncbi:S-layer homology domain-containing protein [Geobacillus subterraneus]|uniref:S-layer homology domain-containing protein n=1 Tax=Geobacillus subterraneus TaxID=129338 RepID=UPI002AC93FFD|nr:S-layer homology domain-containing protein [Geobacillus subterraneus]WPZ18130.1 S-layer homology domain-containing protein [Geobacillus subterraneus]